MLAKFLGGNSGTALSGLLSFVMRIEFGRVIGIGAMLSLSLIIFLLVSCELANIEGFAEQE